MKAWYWIDLFFFFWKELLKSNWQVLKAVLLPNTKLHPAILTVPIELKSDWGITLLANLITLTPGTITVDMSDDKRKLIVHAMFAEDTKAAVLDIKNGFEQKIKRVLP